MMAHPQSGKDDRTASGTVHVLRTARAVTVDAGSVPEALETLAGWLRDNVDDDFSVGTVTFLVHAERLKVEATALLLS